MPSDLTICRNDDGTTSAGSYELSSIFIQKGISPMTTMLGGSKSNKDKNQVSEILRNLAVPAGLLCLPGSDCAGLPRGENKGIVDDNLYDRLVKLASVDKTDSRKQSRRKKPSTAKGTRRRN